jgi:hypothetical protein
MVNSVSSSTSSQYTSQSVTSEELTAEQKQKIAEIEAKYEAKKITEAQKDQQEAEVKADAVKQKQKTENNSTEPSGKVKSASQASQQLNELMKNKETGKVSQDELDSFLVSLKEKSDSKEGTLVDEKA